MQSNEFSAGDALTLDRSQPRQQEYKQDSLPDHLTAFGRGNWAVWRWAGLRGAGFPLKEVFRLTAPECAAAAERLIEAEDEAERVWELALEALMEDYRNCDPAVRPSVSRALKKLKKVKVPDALPDECGSREAIARFASACEALDRAYAAFNRAFDQSVADASQEIAAIARRDDFREAVLWQNRTAFQTAVEQLLKQPADAKRDSKHRQHEELVANYWQRYCAKNDTIGFFGPLGWARLAPEAKAISLQPGAELLAARTVYFERWCVDALADLLNEDQEIRRWMAPRRIPMNRMTSEGVHVLMQGLVRITEAEAAIINACDGERSAREIAAEIAKDRSLGFASEEAVFEALDDMARRSLLVWSVLVPPSPTPDKSFRKLMERVGDERARGRALALIDELDAARQKVAEAAGDVERLDAALAEMDSTFTRLTGNLPTRADGKMYAGRTLVYEDCRREVKVEVGGDILEELAAPLSLLLTSSRWLTFKLSQACRAAFQDVYSELVRETGSPVIDSLTFWMRSQSRLYGNEAGFSNSLHATFQELWAGILSLPEDERSVSYSSEQLRPRVLAAFDAPRPGWQYARYHSPDVMIAAESTDAIRAGDYQFVLGELHLAANTLCPGLFVNQHPSPEDLFRATESDLPNSRIIPLASRDHASSRSMYMLLSPKDYYLEFSFDTTSPWYAKTLQIGSLVVEDRGQGVFVRTMDDTLHLDIIEVFGVLLTDSTMNLFKMLPPVKHRPRVTIDRLVISREQWEFKAEEMEFAFEKQESQRFLAARRWAASLGLPRLLFYKSPVEVKPCYLDLDSPIYVNLFSRIIRKTAASAQNKISLSEMLPTPSDVWLEDAAGNRYTSELRIVAVDLTGSR